jgi:hypothetical protein
MNTVRTFDATYHWTTTRLFGTGYFSVIANELFPAYLRGSAMGFVYNIGRVLSAAAPYLIGHISEHRGASYALCITSAAFLPADPHCNCSPPPVTAAAA